MSDKFIQASPSMDMDYLCSRIICSTHSLETKRQDPECLGGLLTDYQHIESISSDLCDEICKRRKEKYLQNNPINRAVEPNISMQDIDSILSKIKIGNKSPLLSLLLSQQAETGAREDTEQEFLDHISDELTNTEINEFYTTAFGDFLTAKDMTHAQQNSWYLENIKDVYIPRFKFEVTLINIVFNINGLRDMPHYDHFTEIYNIKLNMDAIEHKIHRYAKMANASFTAQANLYNLIKDKDNINPNFALLTYYRINKEEGTYACLAVSDNVADIIASLKFFVEMHQENFNLTCCMLKVVSSIHIKFTKDAYTKPVR